MFYQSSGRFKKATAWFFFFLFYLQLVAPFFVQAQGMQGYIARKNVGSYNLFANADVFRRDSSSDENFLRENFSPLNKRTSVTSNKDGNNNTPIRKKHPSGPGPSQPEMQSFQSVNTNNMVDLFSGDFAYNIPLLDVGGYPVNLHYNSGITMDQESSWVGLGWNINPGTINRTMRGLPDDFNGSDEIRKTTTIKPNRTVGVTVGGDKELLGKPFPKKEFDENGKLLNDSAIFGRPTKLGASIGVIHNNYNGWGVEVGINAGINSGTGVKGPLSGGLSITNNSQSGLDISPSMSSRLTKLGAQTQGNVTIGTNYNSRIGVQGLQMTTQIRLQSKEIDKRIGQRRTTFAVGIPSEISFATPSFTPSISIPFTSRQFTFTTKVGGERWVYHPNFYVQGSFSEQYIAESDQTQVLPAYGYLYYQDAADRQDVLLDFNREKDVSFRGTTPSIAIPSSTYDIYSISGEGTGGMFRPYRGDIGLIYDHAMATKSNSDKFSLDLGFGKVLHAGVDVNKTWANTKNNPWLGDNIMASYIGYKAKDSLYENVNFKNPGEKVLVDKAYYDKIGGDKLMRVQLTPGRPTAVVSATKNMTLFEGAKSKGSVTIGSDTYKTKRDKRTQTISYLSASEASIVGIDRTIKSFDINSFPSTSCNTNYATIQRVGNVRKAHHLSEITVLNNDGRRYVYGLPIYNVDQEDVTFAVDKSGADNTEGLVSYNTSKDNIPGLNDKGKDNYYNKEVIPPYAHSFLLSSILSTDYVDITGDGVTEDDNGDAVKFNYSRIYGDNNPYKWRAPFDYAKASYNEGLKTYNRDDKGTYSYGKKEVWLMNSIESKTMIATFVLETNPESLRKDSHGVNGENGGYSSSQKLYRLKEINLYTKADFLKNGAANAKPIKTVHFGYSYELCPGVPSSNGSGKLTLRKVWFTYNKNNKASLNPYIFYYHSSNPPFNSKSYDRWGNYKNPAGNPGGTGNTLTNGEYPYSLQAGVKDWDSAKAADNAAVWNLSQIKLPSGGLMKITYESDDYGYVQNRRAMQMFSIAGMGNSENGALQSILYEAGKKDRDFFYVYVKLKDAIANTQELKERYLDGVEKLYLCTLTSKYS